MTKWQNWAGSDEPPVELDTLVEVRFRGGHVGVVPARMLDWAHDHYLPWADITHFKVLEEQ